MQVLKGVLLGGDHADLNTFDAIDLEAKDRHLSQNASELAIFKV